MATLAILVLPLTFLCWDRGRDAGAVGSVRDEHPGPHG